VPIRHFLLAKPENTVDRYSRAAVALHNHWASAAALSSAFLSWQPQLRIAIPPRLRMLVLFTQQSAPRAPNCIWYVFWRAIFSRWRITHANALAAMDALPSGNDKTSIAALIPPRNRPAPQWCSTSSRAKNNPGCWDRVAGERSVAYF